MICRTPNFLCACVGAHEHDRKRLVGRPDCTYFLKTWLLPKQYDTIHNVIFSEEIIFFLRVSLLQVLYFSANSCFKFAELFTFDLPFLSLDLLQVAYF